MSIMKSISELRIKVNYIRVSNITVNNVEHVSRLYPRIGLQQMTEIIGNVSKLYNGDLDPITDLA